jgi:cyclophilin family peptidyl-prolyl cis-trans isomerase
MKRLFLLCGLLAWCAFSASAVAQDTVPAVAAAPAPLSLTIGNAASQIDLATVFTVPGVTGQVVQFDTVLGKFNVETLFDAAPNHVTNFLTYVNAGDYTNTFFHRVASFEGATAGTSILQGGGFKTAVGLPGITTRPPVNLEYNLPNARGTLAAARTSDINSATSEWFFNTRDNSTILGASNASGYSVFARVLGTGMTIVDTIAAKPAYNLGGIFTDTPLRDVTVGQTSLLLANLINVNSITVVPLFPSASGQTSVVSFTVASNHPAIATATLLAGHTLSVAPVGPGSAILTLTATDTNGNRAQSTVAVTVARSVPVPTAKTQTIRFTAPPAKLANAAPFDLAATATSKLPVSFELISGPATLGANGKTLTVTGPGTVVVKATQAGDATYLPATAVQVSFKVNPVTQKITFKAPTAAQLAGDLIPLTATSSSGLPVTFQIVSGAATLGEDGHSFALTGGGSIIIKATQPGDLIYQAAPPVQVTVRIMQSLQTLTFNPPASVLLDGSPLLLTATSNANLPVTLSVVSGPATLGGDNRTLTLTGSGIVTLSATQPGNIRVKAATAVTKKITVNLAPAALATGNGFVVFTTLDGDREANGFKVVSATLLQDPKEGVVDSFGVTTTHPKLSYTYKRLTATTAQFVVTDNYVEVSTDADSHERRETGTATVTINVTFTGRNVNGDTEGTVTLTGTSRGTLTAFDAALSKVVSKAITGKISATGTCVFVTDAADLTAYIDAFYATP